MLPIRWIARAAYTDVRANSGRIRSKHGYKRAWPPHFHRKTSPWSGQVPSDCPSRRAFCLEVTGSPYTVGARLTASAHTHDGATRHFTAPFITEPEQATPPRWVVVATKTYQTEQAAIWLRQLHTDQTTLIVVQNGVDHVERLSPYWPQGALLPAIISMPSARSQPNVVHQRRVGTMRLLEHPDGHRFAELFDPAVNVSCAEDWVTEAWTKLLLNAPLGLCTLALAANGALLKPPLLDVAKASMREIIGVGKAVGANFDDQESLIESTLAKIAKNPEHKSSITQDRLAGKPMEWRARNEIVVRLAHRYGLEVPVNATLAAALGAADSHPLPPS